ncbi:MAG: hypothetical protein D8M62_12510 [Proteobacteria bacterium]|nr:hypothetical protein [Pseudomonadota bacterium]
MIACDKQPENKEKQSTVSIESEAITSVQNYEVRDDKIIIENKSYLFDVSNHTIDEFEALLTRAEEVSQAHAPGYEDLKIEMIIHGPDIDWFTQQNYEINRQLVDLAARLDAYDIIDMKVCEKTMTKRGVDREDIPSFIESVPYAPIEIEKRLQEGYINL